jgi:alkylated DNA repair dioxygenase AlkB
VTTKQQLPPERQSDLFAAEPTLPAGFAYGEAVISSDDEEALLKRFEALPFKPFEFHGYLGHRHVVSFGWRYDYAGRSLRDSDAIPPFLLPLRDRAAAFADVAPEGLQQILINKYPPGAGIGWHRDKPMFEDIIAISLSSPCVLRFRRKQGTGWQRAAKDVRPRSAYLLRGQSRRDWEHSVPPVDRLRYSVTFRNFVEGDTHTQSHRS